MKFSIGDRILLKRSGEEGHVMAFINKDMLEVEVDGVTFPVHLDDIDHPYMKWFTEKAKKAKASLPEQLPVEKLATRAARLANGAYLSFMPVFKIDSMEEVVDVLKVYLLNELAVPVRFSYDVRIAGKSDFRHEGVLHPFGNLYLHSVLYTDMNDQPRFHWQLADAQNPALAPATGVLRIKPQKLFEHIGALMTSGQATFSYLLADDFYAPAKKEPLPAYVPPARVEAPMVTAGTIEAARQEVDLHIEALVGNRKRMSNTEIVQTQLDALKHYVQLAIVHRQERLVVIHGLGKGRLREEVHAVLKTIPEIARFKNEWSGKYGFGATEILFRR